MTLLDRTLIVIATLAVIMLLENRGINALIEHRYRKRGWRTL